MTDQSSPTVLSATESVRFEETLSNGELNPNSIAAENVVDLASIAVNLLARQDKIQPYKAGHVTALTQTLVRAMNDAATQLTGVATMNKGVSLLVRRALDRALMITPPPFDQAGSPQADEAWAAWSKKLTGRIVVTISAGVEAWTYTKNASDASPAPWAFFVSAP